MKLYSFVNRYLIPIQKGIQTAHMVSEMFQENENNKLLLDWAQNHKTIIMLDGGLCDNMRRLKEMCVLSGYLYAYFWNQIWMV